MTHNTLGWSSRWMFVLAATGSAVGLGNIWRFPYVTGENGGGAFVIVYLICVLLVGLPVMIGEILLGRWGGGSPVNAIKKVASKEGLSKKWRFLGLMGVAAGFLILSFYSVIAGWSLAYTKMFLVDYSNFESVEKNQEIFSVLTESAGLMLFWHTFFMLITGIVVAKGIKDGLENAVKYLMPILFLMLALLVLYASVAGNFSSAILYLFKPNFEAFETKSLLAALGQAFFSLSLGMGSIMAYGAYLSPKTPILSNGLIIALADTLVALMAGLAIFPIVFAHGMEPSQGPGLVFVSLAAGFSSMPFGQVFGFFFFLLLSIAAWTSSISLLEPAVGWITERSKWSRPKSCIVAGGIAWIFGIGSILSFNHGQRVKILGLNFFEFCEFLSTSVMLPLGGLLISILVGWKLNKARVFKQLGLSVEGKTTNLIFSSMRFLAPIGVFCILLESCGLLEYLTMKFGF